MTDTTIAVPAEATRLTQQAIALRAEVEALPVVLDDTTIQRAGAIAQRLARFVRAGHQVMDPFCEITHAAWKAALAHRAAILDPAEELKTTVGIRMVAYELEQAQQREIAEVAAREARAAAERAAQEAADAETARLRAAAEDQRIAEAAEAEARGDLEAADRLIEAPVVVPVVAPAPVFAPPVVAPETPKVEGISYRSEWSARLNSLPDLVAAAAAGNSTAMGCLTFDLPQANRLARALKGKLYVPGIEVVERRIQVTKL